MDLINLKGIGKKSVVALNNKGIFSCSDLAKMLPIKYYNLEQPQAFVPNKKASVIEVELVENPSTQFIKKLTITRVKAQDLNSDRVITLVWFNQRYVKNAYKQGQKYVVYGNSRQNDFLVVSAFASSAKEENLGMYPVYKKVGVSRKVLQNAILQCQEETPISSAISPDIIQDMGIISLEIAYKNVHNSKTEQQLKKALNRIELEQAVEYLLGEGNFIGQKRIVRTPFKDTGFNQFLDCLPFDLTKGQSQSINDIMQDFSKSVSTNRLILGEVGSGKTVVAFLAALVAVKNGFQVAFLAPTEILARQHYNSFNKYFSRVCSSALITSSEEGRTSAENAVKTGLVNVVFGTHVLATSTNFKNLGLVIIDEQQRFGVELRAKMVEKCVTRDCLSLTATPIPRSVLLALSGVLDTSKIEERPSVKNIKTHFIGHSREADMWQFLKEQTKVFVVCPRIEETDDPFEEQEVSSVKALEKKLKSVFGAGEVLRVDGSMSAEEQKNVMQRFESGKERVLVATTVIEVGVDVPQANAIVICGAERFGLSTLHQLRGRVGRNGQESYCFVMLDKKPSEQTFARLSFFKDNDNGFKIAEYDFNTRGAGDVFGTRQSGESLVMFSSAVLEQATIIVKKMGQKRVLISNN